VSVIEIIAIVVVVIAAAIGAPVSAVTKIQIETGQAKVKARLVSL
jgi:hypothetical protein